MTPVSYAPAVVFGLRGRIGRRQFAVSALYQGFLSVVLTAGVLAGCGGPLVEGLAEARLAGSWLPADPALLVPVALLTVLQVALSTFTFTAIRARLHDLSMSTWWTVPMSVPTLVWLAGEFLPLGGTSDAFSNIGTYGSILLAAPLFLAPGKAEANAYGPPPAPRDAASAAAPTRQAG